MNRREFLEAATAVTATVALSEAIPAKHSWAFVRISFHAGYGWLAFGTRDDDRAFSHHAASKEEALALLDQFLDPKHVGFAPIYA